MWYTPKKKEWSDMEAMIRDWMNWAWPSGDHIVEQHVHNLDTILWFTGMNPAKAVGVGGRARRVTGDQFDFFAVQFTYVNGTRLESMCRQIDGCANDVSEYVVGTEGYTNCKNTIFDPIGKEVWKYQEAGADPGKSKFAALDQEHVDFVTAIRRNEPINETEYVAHATLTAVMGRTAA
jgi:predicted dehydrogenase